MEDQMEKSRTLSGTGASVLLLSIFSLVLLQACHSPIYTEVKVDCSPGRNGDPGPGAPCVKDPVAVNSPVQPNAIAVDTATPPKPTGQSIPANSLCTWTGGQNKKCRAPGTPNCSFSPNKTCHDTYNLSSGKCECGCF